MAVGDRIKESTTTTSTGTYELDGTVSTFQTFVTGVEAANGALSPRVYTDVPYTCIQSDANGNNIDVEIGRGTLTAGVAGAKDTITRGTIRYSTNGNAKVDWGAGTKTIVCAPQAEDINIGHGWVLTKTADQDGIGTSATKVTWETERFSTTLATVSLASNRITVNKAGDWLVGCTAPLQNNNAARTGCWLGIYKNGAEVIMAENQVEQSGSYEPGGTALIITLAEGDYVEVFAKHDLATDLDILYVDPASPITMGEAAFFGNLVSL